MKDKFRENFFIALPAALISVVIILIMSFNTEIAGDISNDYNLIQIIPYVLVLIGGIIGINVFVVLMIGIASGSVVMLATGTNDIITLFDHVKDGISGMSETIMVTILVSAICALIRECGGFDALLYGIKKVFKGKKGGQFGMGVLVGVLDIATANNTVAIVMANPIAKNIADEYGISPEKSASILDTFSCFFQAILPYGAQILAAIGIANGISAFEIIPLLFYPYLLLISSLLFILFKKEKTVQK